MSKFFVKYDTENRPSNVSEHGELIPGGGGNENTSMAINVIEIELDYDFHLTKLAVNNEIIPASKNEMDSEYDNLNYTQHFVLEVIEEYHQKILEILNDFTVVKYTCGDNTYINSEYNTNGEIFLPLITETYITFMSEYIPV